MLTFNNSNLLNTINNINLLTFNHTILVPRMLGITSCLDRFLKHNLVHGFFDTFFPITQAQSHHSLYTF